MMQASYSRLDGRHSGTPRLGLGIPLLTRAIAFTLVLLCGLAFSSAVKAGALEIRTFVRTVADIDRAAAFYESALEFKRVSDRIIVDQDYDYMTGVFAARVRNVTLRLGEETIELEQFLVPTNDPIRMEGRSQDLWFQHMAIVVSDMQRAYERMLRHGAKLISDGPQTIPASNAAAAGIQALKFRDPDGHPLELLQFPADKGQPRWQRAAGRLFLGIDHSAITVSDTEQSATFYRDLLGLSIAGESLNTGITQERLDGAPGARVRVTGLRPARPSGPGLEFLHYLAPSDGLRSPDSVSSGSRPNELLRTRVVLEVEDLEQLAAKLQAHKARFVSPRVVALREMGYSKGLIVRDPDGHALLLVQR